MSVNVAAQGKRKKLADGPYQSRAGRPALGESQNADEGATDEQHSLSPHIPRPREVTQAPHKRPALERCDLLCSLPTTLVQRAPVGTQKRRLSTVMMTHTKLEVRHSMLADRHIEGVLHRGMLNSEQILQGSSTRTRLALVRLEAPPLIVAAIFYDVRLRDMGMDCTFPPMRRITGQHPRVHGQGILMHQEGDTSLPVTLTAIAHEKPDHTSAGRHRPR